MPFGDVATGSGSIWRPRSGEIPRPTRTDKLMALQAEVEQNERANGNKSLAQVKPVDVVASPTASQPCRKALRGGVNPKSRRGVAGARRMMGKLPEFVSLNAAQLALREPGGSSVLELALLAPLFLLLLLGTVDMGQAFYAAIEVSAAANAGAEYGMQNPTDTAGMQEAAVLDGADLKNLAANASWGCECSDGSSASVSCASAPTCSVNAVDYVQVTTSMTYVPIIKVPGIPSSLALKGSARMRAMK